MNFRDDRGIVSSLPRSEQESFPPAQRRSRQVNMRSCAGSHAAKTLLERAHEQHVVPTRYVSVRRCAVVRACMTDGFWRGCADHAVRTACSTGLSSDSCIGCSDLLPLTAGVVAVLACGARQRCRPVVLAQCRASGRL